MAVGHAMGRTLAMPVTHSGETSFSFMSTSMETVGRAVELGVYVWCRCGRTNLKCIVEWELSVLSMRCTPFHLQSPDWMDSNYHSLPWQGGKSESFFTSTSLFCDQQYHTVTEVPGSMLSVIHYTLNRWLPANAKSNWNMLHLYIIWTLDMIPKCRACVYRSDLRLV